MAARLYVFFSSFSSCFLFFAHCLVPFVPLPSASPGSQLTSERVPGTSLGAGFKRSPMGTGEQLAGGGVASGGGGES